MTVQQRVWQIVIKITNKKKVMSSMKFIVFAIVFWMLNCMEIHAQSSCDKLYAEGVSMQQIMTIPAQKKAISAFEKARACYDAKKDRDLCDKQIKVCNNTISLLKKKLNNVGNKKKETDASKADTVAEDVQKVSEQEKKEILLSFPKAYMKFKGKGGEFQKVKVECNEDNWVVSDCPSWVHYSISSDKEIVIEVDRNPSNKEERSGSLIVKCGDKSATLTIIQERYKKFGII